jgi:hypothetical protein
MPGNSTLEEVGTCTRTIGIKTTHDKARFTVVLGARADGSKIHRMVIFKGKRKDKTLEMLTRVVVQIQEHAWMSEDLTSRWLTMLWGTGWSTDN